LRPSDKLDKKYDTERKRELLVQIQALVSSMSSKIKNVQAERSDVRVEAKRT
jgi:hypothetical protein